MDNRTDRVQHMPAGQVVGFRDLYSAGFFLVSLLFHPFGTFQTELYARIGVDGVVDTAVAGNKAAISVPVRHTEFRFWKTAAVL